MNWGTFGTFVVFVSIVIVIPGPDVAITMKNALVGGWRQGGAAVAGIGAASLIQSVAAVSGLSVLIVRSEPVFLAIKWAGVAYLVVLAVQALRSAWRGQYRVDATLATRPAAVGVRLRQGFLCNITNPKIIVFNLAVFPQFLGADASVLSSALFAITLPALGSLYLVLLVAGVGRARAIFSRSRVRRAMDVVTGGALLGFSARLALE